MSKEVPVLLPFTPSAKPAVCLNGLIGIGHRQFWCHPHTYVSVSPSRGIVLGLHMLFKRYYWTHLTEEETEITGSLSGIIRIQTQAVLLHHTVRHLRYLDSSNPNPTHVPPAPACLESTLPCYQLSYPRQGQPSGCPRLIEAEERRKFHPQGVLSSTFFCPPLTGMEPRWASLQLH